MPQALLRSTINSYLNDKSIFDFISNNKDLLSGATLDIGCGKMRYKDIILSNKKTSYVGLDLLAGKFTYSVTADLYWDGITIPLKDNSVQSEILFEVLEHCSEPLVVLNEAYRVLSPGGILMFSVPFLYQLHGTPYDYTRFTPEGLRHILKKAGFKDIHLEASGAWDASLGQMIGIWIEHRPLPSTVRKILRALFVPIFKILLNRDKKHISKGIDEHAIMPGILGWAKK